MDTSKEYILMCEKAVEIQDNWSPICPDCVYMPICCKTFLGKIETVSHAKGIGYLINSRQISDMNEVLILRKNSIWLPRQDQLQEMVEIKGWARQLEAMAKFSNCSSRNFEWSWEKFWLAFVMKEEYNKTWNGTEWKETT